MDVSILTYATDLLVQLITHATLPLSFFPTDPLLDQGQYTALTLAMKREGNEPVIAMLRAAGDAATSKGGTKGKK